MASDSPLLEEPSSVQSTKNQSAHESPDLSEITETVEPLDRDEIFEVLSNQRRRYVLRYLKENYVADEPIDFRELVDQVAAWENSTSVDQLSSSDRKCVYTALRQTHLPKLDSMNVVKFDNQRGEIEATETIDDVLVYMEYVPEDDISWSQYYLLLSGACGLLALGVLLGIGPFANLPGLVIGFVIACMFGISALIQAVHPMSVQLPYAE